MQWNEAASVLEPPRRRGPATAMVVAELGLDEDALADVLAWARGRVDALLAALDDDELRALLDPAPAAASWPPAASLERRAEPRYSLGEPAIVEIGSWSELVTLYTKDISCGGMFVQSEDPPPREAEVAVQLRLPGGAGTLDFEGVVVHVVTVEQAAARGRTPGFGLQFLGLTGERRRTLQRLIERAELAQAAPHDRGPTLQELGFMCAPSDRGARLRLTLSEPERRTMEALRDELALLRGCGDLQVLGLGAADDLDAAREAFERLARRWHPSVAHRDAPPEIRRLATEIFLRIEQAYRRLCDAPRRGAVPPPPPYASVPRPRATRADAVPRRAQPTPVPVRASQPTPVPVRASQPTPVPVRASQPTPPPGPPSLSPVEADEVRARQRARLAQRLMSRLVERSEQLTSQLRRRDPALAPSRPPRDAHRVLVDEAVRLVADKRYADAASRLEQALQHRAEPRTRVLLGVVQARQAVAERDFPRARARYEAVLELDPSNVLAQRELLILAALAR